MRNILSITRRDLAAYFTSPMGYVYLMVFVTVSVGIYVTGLFSSPLIMVDIRPFFDNLPLLLCVLVPAITMRVWAEERKENTWEMLLTFPMRAYELVIGKFLASMAFFAIAVFATITVPWMLASLGSPDWGVIWGGYIGILLVGSMFFSMGIFFSGFFKDQVVAFVITLLACLMLFLLGTSFIEGFLDARFGDWNVGTLLSEVMGVFTHFSPFTRGVVDLADVLYFLAWTVLFLWLNVMYIDGRNRPGAKIMFASALVMTVVIGMLFNWIMSDTSLQRIDLTENKIYTVTDATKEELQGLEAPVTVSLYITPQAEMPTGFKQLERDITDKLAELEVASGGKMHTKVIHLEAANIVSAQPTTSDEDEEKTEEEKLEERMYDKGVEPFSVNVQGEASASSQLIYSCLGVAYAEKNEEIIPYIIPANLPELEYRLVSTVYKLTREKLPKVVVVAPSEAVNIPPQLRMMYEQQGMQIPQSRDLFSGLSRILESEKYEVQRVEFNKDQPLPDDFDTLVILNPRDLTERHHWEINRALRSGKSVVLAVQQYLWDYRPTRDRIQVTRSSENPNVNPLLENYGLGINEDTLMDVNAVGIGIPMGIFQQELSLPLHMIIPSENMNEDSAVTSNLGTILYFWGSALNIDDKKLDELGLEHTVLMTTSDRAWLETAEPTTPEFSFEEPTDSSKRQAYPVAVRVKGQFPDAFEGKERPEWPEPEQMPGQPPQPPSEEEAPATPVEPAPGELVLMGCSEPFKDDYLRVAGGSNLQLLFKMIDGVTLKESIANIRARTPIMRTIDKPEDSVVRKWQIVNYGLANLVIAGIGIAVVTMRRRSRNAYTMSYASKQA